MTVETHETPVAEPLDADAALSSAADARCTASEDFVRAISDLLDTDPNDLLSELGYYDRGKQSAEPAPLTA